MRVSRKAIGYDQWAARNIDPFGAVRFEPRPDLEPPCPEANRFTAVIGISLILLSMLLSFLAWKPVSIGDPWAEADHWYRANLTRNDNHFELRRDTTPEDILYHGKPPRLLTPP